MYLLNILYKIIIFSIFIIITGCTNRVYEGVDNHLQKICDYSGYGKKALPDSLKKYNSVYSILIQYNPDLNYKKVAKQLHHFKKIEILGVAGETMKEFPLELTELNNIVELDLRRGHIKTFPKEISKMTSVKRVLLGYSDLGGMNSDELDVLFKTLSGFPNLEELFLSNNNLSYLPKSVESLNKLKRINIMVNDFDSIPRSLVNISGIERLSLDYFESISNSNSLSAFKKLKYVYLNFDNDFRGDIDEIIVSLELKHKNIKFYVL